MSAQTAPRATDAAAPRPNRPLDKDLRGYLETNADILTVVKKPVSLAHIPALSAESEGPILFENIVEKPGFRLCDMLVKHRWSQCRALGQTEKTYLPTLAQRLRKAPRGFVEVATGRELARFEDPEMLAGLARFTPDGTRLVVQAPNGLRVWDLRRVRRELAKLGLDWDAPPFPQATEDEGEPIRAAFVGS